ncbi:ankyrin repeat domain-containing protein 45 [Plakobranchus ocellatus]|uniref:Ankyrin repeat domain-containing protein 45 n=1 Tax=Plakobranchus ocellatus TaxID=259542 RepID=A0AAV3XTM9_9GAST|nr:ankyrin repeat domain-containing protein 45 [Plakobranchus ocellatus]
MTQENSDTGLNVEEQVAGSEQDLKIQHSRSTTESALESNGEGEDQGEGEDSEIEQLLPGTNIITHCIYKNDPNRLIRCFEDDQDPYKADVLDLLNERDENGKSPLDLAACLGRNQITKELLQRGADVNNITTKGYSCLHYAAVWGRMPVVKMLIEHGADLRQTNAHGERPREAAIRYNHEECVDFLDWAEAKTLLQEAIKHTQDTIADVDKAVAGRMTKEEKTISLNTAKEKQEWLDSTEDATTQDFIAQRIALMDVVGPVLQKLLEPRHPGQALRAALNLAVDHSLSVSLGPSQEHLQPRRGLGPGVQYSIPREAREKGSKETIRAVNQSKTALDFRNIKHKQKAGGYSQFGHICDKNPVLNC